MAIRRQLAACALLGVLAGVPACTLPPDSPTVIASATGTGPDDAYRVVSVAQEYDVLRLLGVGLVRQTVRLIDGRPFDVLTVRDAAGTERDLWFDISRFYGR